MVVVAVAGGTGGVGRTVLDAIAKAGEHKAIVLSRTVSSPMLCFNARILNLHYSGSSCHRNRRTETFCCRL